MIVDVKVVHAALAQVAALEERLAAASDARDRHTRRDDHLGALGRELADDAGAAHLAVEAASAALRRLDRELSDVAQAAASRRERLAVVADARQAVAVRSELEALEWRREALEAEALGLLGALEAAEAAAGEADDGTSRQEVRSRAELGALAQAADRGAAALAAGEQEMARLLALLPDDIARHLRRLQGRDGQGVAAIRGGACGGCFERLPAAMVAEVELRRTVVRCLSCGRFVI
jgi:predicted  nucleic acid-binding Zn-ribbon protein